MSAPRTPGQSLALHILGGVLSTVLVTLVVTQLAKRREAAESAPLPGPIVPGHGQA